MISRMTQAPSHSYRSRDPSSNKHWLGGVMAGWPSLRIFFAMICGWVFGCFGVIGTRPRRTTFPHQNHATTRRSSRLQQTARAPRSKCAHQSRAQIPGEGRGPVSRAEVPIASSAQNAQRDPVSRQKQHSHAARRPSTAADPGRGLTSFLRSPRPTSGGGAAVYVPTPSFDSLRMKESPIVARALIRSLSKDVPVEGRGRMADAARFQPASPEAAP